MGVTIQVVPKLKDMTTWTNKRSKWAKLAREEHDVAWEFEGPGGGYTGRMLIDGQIYTPSQATKKFLKLEVNG